MGSKNVFSEQEVAEILRNAIAIEEQGLVDHAYKPGVTLEELQRVADEIGVSPKALEMALNLEGSPAAQKKRVLTFKESFERVVQGELDPRDFDVILSHLKLMQTNQSSGVTQVGRTLTAQSWTGAGQANVKVSARHGRTKIEVTSSPLVAIMGALYPATLVGIATGVGVGSANPIAGILTALAFIGSGAWGCRALLNANHRRSAELADKLQESVEEHLNETDQNLALRASAEQEASKTETGTAVQKIDLP